MEPDPRVIQFLMGLRRLGWANEATLSAIERTPRDLFAPEGHGAQAYDEAALAIEEGEHMLPPTAAAALAAVVGAEPREKVMEIGTGTGYLTAILARLARRVYTIERHRTVSIAAESRFQSMRLNNIVAMRGDGNEGWPGQAPFDCIILTAATHAPPEALLMQLREGGVLAGPVGGDEGLRLMRYTREGDDAVAKQIYDGPIGAIGLLGAA